MTKNAKSASADREPAPQVQVPPDPTPARPSPAPPAVHAVLLRATNGVRRGAVVRGPAGVVSDLIELREARAATESDIAVCGRVIDL
ncbi:hypothetical protein OVA11_19040 [Caulobacter sp. SL161]|uniref:hypothetical protein n=1 Tax=Caulobacter sp. SL161 TaxID=2995156 RepID=UPI0022741C27|nr:hypothetical protein [Caulobacter sp. SL161]MCY1649074.1 hypothetical protein [Caulobacter sp. SL161]